PVHVDLRQHHVFGKRPVRMLEFCAVQGVAGGRMPSYTRVTRVAGDVMGDDNPVSHLPFRVDIVSDLCNHPRAFVPERPDTPGSTLISGSTTYSANAPYACLNFVRCRVSQAVACPRIHALHVLQGT